MTLMLTLFLGATAAMADEPGELQHPPGPLDPLVVVSELPKVTEVRSWWETADTLPGSTNAIERVVTLTPGGRVDGHTLRLGMGTPEIYVDGARISYEAPRRIRPKLPTLH